MVMRGAPRAETHGRAPARRTPPPQGRASTCRAAPLSISAVPAQKLVSQVEASPPFVVRAARSSVGAGRAV